MNVKLMKKLCRMNQYQLHSTMVQYLKDKEYKLKQSKEYIIAEGDLPIILMAHLDTVRPTSPPENIYFDKDKNVMWSPELLGADDRAGVYAIIRILEQGYRPHVIFTLGEEIGGIGAKAIVKKFKKCPIDDVKALIQLDRRGSNDCVFYDCDNEDFLKYIESFGFEEDFGSFTDISIIAPQWGIAAVNLSVGYYNEHTNYEFLSCNELYSTINKVINILDKSDSMEYYKYIPRKYIYTCYCCGNTIESIKSPFYIQNPNAVKGWVPVCNNCYNRFYYNFEKEKDY